MASQSSSTIYEPVVHKKNTGRIILSQATFQFLVSSNGDSSSNAMVDLSWNKVSKHQVSPASHPKSLLKVVLIEGAGKPLTFSFEERPELERIRKDISERLKDFSSQHSSLLQSFATPSKSSLGESTNGKNGGTKRKLSSSRESLLATGKTSKRSFGELDPTSLAVTRSSLLASNPTLRSQHKYLVEESETVAEDDFWNTHKSLLEEEYARISGIARAGTSSLLQSHLQVLTGRITLGVEEMRQIFIMYPAVHKAYEEKVPLELSDEQFWRKYLESEYFHRDRGRVGSASGRHKSSNSGNEKEEGKAAKTDTKDQEARAAVAAADDLFSRYDQKLRESGQLNDDEQPSQQKRKWGTKLAVGQFDLASTFETERGNVLEGPRDNHPHYDESNTIGAKVIQKYNRHWAMVLNPEEAVAGSNLMEVARNSVQDAIPNDSDAMAGGGLDDEMQRLVGFASASAENANHALGVGESDEYETLTLKNVDVYYNGSNQGTSKEGPQDTEAIIKENTYFTKYMVGVTKDMLENLNKKDSTSTTQLNDAFPPPGHGQQLLMALTKRMAKDSKTDADTLEVVNSLPVDFKKKLHSYFRRTSELLRHFYGLRRLALETEEAGNSSNAYHQKLKKIVTGLNNLHSEIGAMRSEQMNKAQGKVMGAMCFQIMEQLNWAFKQHREGSGSGSGSGGFTTIETF